MDIGEIPGLVRHWVSDGIHRCGALCALLIWNHERMRLQKKFQTAVLSELGINGRNVTMSQKVIQLSDKASITLGQDGGIAQIAIQAGATAGGGDLKDFAEVGVQAYAKVHEDQIIDVAFVAIEKKANGNSMIVGALEALKVELKSLEAK